MKNRNMGHAMSSKGGGRPLRVCMLLPKLQIGGAEMQVLGLMRNLDPARFSVSLCCFNHGDRNMEREVEQHGVNVFHIDFRWRRSPVAFARLVRYLRRWNFDVLHCHLPLADSIGRLAGAIAGVPVLVTTEHGKNLWKGRLYLVLERILNRFTDMRICVSRDIMEIRRLREGAPPGKLVYIPNAIDSDAFKRPAKGRAAVLAEFGWPADSDLVVSVGRLVVEKNYTGSRGDIPDVLAAADVFVLSSVREGLPVALLEAMAAGTAIAATSVGGIPEVIQDGESGLLVPAEDAAALAEAVGTLLANADLRRTLGAEARRIVERDYGIGRIAERIGTIYRELYDAKKVLHRV